MYKNNALTKFKLFLNVLRRGVIALFLPRSKFHHSLMHIFRPSSMLLYGITACLIAGMVLSTTDVNAQRRKKRSTKKEIVKPDPDPWDIDTLIKPIPMNRALFTDKVSKWQDRLDERDGIKDRQVHFIDENYSEAFTKGLITNVDLLEIHIENMNIDHSQKIRFHRAVEGMLMRTASKPWGNLPPNYFMRLVENMEDMMIAIVENDIEDFVADHPDEFTFANSFFLEDYPAARAAFFKSYGLKYPEKMIKQLEIISKEPYADDIVAAVAHKDPATILNYATSTSYMSSVMRRNKDPLVQAIVKIADQSGSPLKALPFLGAVYRGEMTISEVDAFTKDDVQYYKHLVQLKLQNETISANKIDEEINYRALKFVRIINELHEEPAAVRFKAIQPFNAPELYYMMIGGQDEIYTSSFTGGTYPLMLSTLSPKTGDQLLEDIHMDHFRTFIRMSAGFNTLKNFFATIEEGKKVALMKQFVANLEQGDEDDLEDAVDVADAFGSINDPDLLDFLRKEVQANYERVYKAKNEHSKKGVIVYGLLGTIFNEDKSAQLNLPIPPVTYVPYKSLVNSNGNVVIQAFFYGDEDGRMSYNSFKSTFPSSKWTATANKDWVLYQSNKGKNPVYVYANLPLEEPEDEAAQKRLQQYFENSDITPSIVIHRGHSYHLSGSLANLNPEVKIVMLGSCGGYHNLANVLDRSPEASIISSKQTGAARVNEPIIAEMLRQIMDGKDVDWVTCWTDLSGYFKKQGKMEQDLFNDYVPPHKNLGAIFIKAYRKMMAATNTD